MCRWFKVLAADQECDVAMLQLDGAGFVPLAVAPESPVGASVAVVAHPDRRFYTLTTGIISRHFIVEQSGREVTWITATADIGNGCSGAPLLNECGAVVGIASHTQSIRAVSAEDHQPSPETKVAWFTPSDAILRLANLGVEGSSERPAEPILLPTEQAQAQQIPGGASQLTGGRNPRDLMFLAGGRRITGITSSGGIVPFLADSGIVRLCGDEIYVARPYGIQPTVTVYNRAGEQVRTIPVPAEVRYFVSYVVSPDGRIAFLDNESDAIYFVDRTGKYLKTVRMREVPDSGLQNCDGVVAGNKLIVSEDGSKRLLAIDLDVYEATIFRDLRQLPGSWLGSITLAAGKFYVCTPNQVFSFSPDDPTEHHVATLPEGIFNIAGIAHQAGRLFVVANKAGVVYEIDLASGNIKLIADGLQDPRGIVVLPVVADTGGQFTSSPARAPDPGGISIETFLARPFTGKPKFVIPQENSEISEDLQACAENLKKIDAAIQQYRKDHGQPPDWLSDLVPNYLSQETLLCPKDPAHSSLSAPDPKLPCSYSWQLSWASSPFMENPIPYRTFKEQQVPVYGGVVPMVRCMHHGSGRILNLSLDGQIYWAALTWESLFRPNPSSGPERRGRTTPQTASERPLDLVARPSSASLAAASGTPESTVTAPEPQGQPAAGSKEPRMPVRVSLEHNTELSVGYCRPRGIELSANEPPQKWLLPPIDGATYRRFWAQQSFGRNTMMNIVVHTPHAPEAGPWDFFVVFDGDVDFRSTVPATVAVRSQKKIEFNVAYGSSAKQPYAIWVYPNTLNPGRYSLTYYRACIRTGATDVLGRECRIALSDDDGDGLYSDLADTMVLVGHEVDGHWVYDNRVMADSPIQIGPSDCFTIEISEDGSSALLRLAEYGILEGSVIQESLATAIPRARVKMTPYEFEALTDPSGRYEMRLPVGRYSEAQITAQGYIPEHVRRVPVISHITRANLNVRLNLAKAPHNGEVTLYDGDSFHFLSGQRYKFTGGDFYFRCRESEPKFLANNGHQGGLVDLGQIQTPLNAVNPPSGQYDHFGVLAEVGHVYASPARQGEEGCHIIFRVTEIKQGESCTLTYYYRQGEPIQ